jgi:hypothetical protein
MLSRERGDRRTMSRFLCVGHAALPQPTDTTAASTPGRQPAGPTANDRQRIDELAARKSTTRSALLTEVLVAQTKARDAPTRRGGGG